MRTLLLVAMLIGCGDDMQMPDAATVDAGPPPDAALTCTGITPQQSLNVPIGGCCSESAHPLCGGSQNGVCVVDRCVLQCSGHSPACPNGEPTQRTAPDGHMQCICL